MSNLINGPRRASRGEIEFMGEIDAGTRDQITAMWANRIAGFNSHRTGQYLRDFAKGAQIIFDGKVFAAGRRAYSLKVAVFFAVLQARKLLGLPRVHGDVLEATVEKTAGPGYLTRFVFVQLAGEKLRKVARCEQTLTVDADGLSFHTFSMDTLPPAQWPVREESGVPGNLVRAFDV
jgi:hypothetical protein